jgi:zinc protease
MEGGSLVLLADQIKKLGVAELTANLMNESTNKYTTEQISAELEKIGSSITFGASKTQTYINVYCLKKNLDATLKLLEEKLLNPGFKEEDFTLAKKQYKESIRNEGTSANTMAEKAFNQALYGNSVMGNEPSLKTIENISLQDVKDYYKNYYTPTGTNLVVVGDVEESDVKAKLEFLNKWAAKEVKIQPIVEMASPQEPQFFIYNKDAAPSSVIIMGYPSIKYDATGDYYKNRIANFIFGGNFNSRLNLNLREEKGYTYGIYSGFRGDKYTGKFVISSSVKRSATAASLAEIMKEFKKYQTEGITDKELEFTKNSLLNEEALKYESPYQKASFLSNISRNGLDKDYTSKQNQLLKSMTKDDVNQQIKKHFDANKLTTVIAGDKDLIQIQLDKMAKDKQNKEVLDKVKLKKISVD